MIDRAEERFRDTANVIVSATEWLAHINAAYRAFLRAAKWPALIAETTATVAANGRSVALPSVALQGGVVSVLLPSGVPLEPQPADLSIKNIRYWTDRATTPLWYEIRGSRVAVLPAWSAGGSLTVAYLAAPTALTTVSSPVIPETYHDALIAGALALAYLDDGNADAAERYNGEFDRFVSSATEHRHDGSSDPDIPSHPASRTHPR